MRITGSFSDVGASASLTLRPNETATLRVQAGLWEGRAMAEFSRNGGASWFTAKSSLGQAVEFTALEGDEGSALSYLITNETPRTMKLRLRNALNTDGSFIYALADVAGDVLEVLVRGNDGPALIRTDRGIEVVNFHHGSLVGAYEELVLNDAAPTPLSTSIYESRLTTNGTPNEATIGDGAGAVVGQRKLITLVALGDVGETVDLDADNIVTVDDTLTAVSIDDAGGFILLEWNGSKWEVIRATLATLTPV